jgi:hypothetical protein
MQFLLTGFTPGTEFRVFAFQGIEADRTRTEFTVRTDLSLIRRYGIRMQELPLLCRGLLERKDAEVEERRNAGREVPDAGGEDRTLTFTEEEMRIHATNCAAEREAAKLRKSTRRAASA